MDDKDQLALHTAIYDYFTWLASSSVASVPRVARAPEDGKKKGEADTDAIGLSAATNGLGGLPASDLNDFGHDSNSTSVRTACQVNPGFTRLILSALEEAFPFAIIPRQYYPPGRLPDLASRYLANQKNTKEGRLQHASQIEEVHTTLATNEDNRKSQAENANLELELVQARAQVEHLVSLLAEYRLGHQTSDFPNPTREGQLLYDAMSQRHFLQQSPLAVEQQTTEEFAEPLGPNTTSTSENLSEIFVKYKETLVGKKWMSKYEELKKFRETFGHCTVSMKQNKSLCIWTQNQRRNIRKAVIMAENKRLLDDIQFDWGVHEPSASSEKEIEAGRRIEEGRVFLNSTPQDSFPEALTDQQLDGADSGNDDVASEREVEDWQPSTDRRAQYPIGEEIGDNVANSQSDNSNDNGGPTTMDRSDKTHGSSAVDFTSQASDTESVVGDDCPQAMNIEKYPQLPSEEEEPSTQEQDDNSLTAPLSEDHARAVNEYKKTPNGKRWISTYKELKAYKERHGHCDVLQNGDNRRLGHWVKNQRQLYKRSLAEEESPHYDVLLAARKRLLDIIEFGWGKSRMAEDEIEDIEWRQWMESFKELKKYKMKHGNFRVCSSTSKTLSIWAWKQRVFHQKWLTNSLNSEDISKTEFEKHKKLLDTIQFDWRLRVWDTDHLQKADQIQQQNPPAHKTRFWHVWRLRYEELKEFKAKYGHCRVPLKFNENKSLGIWVYKQRKKFNKKNLNDQSVFKEDFEEQKQLLDEIQFPWHQHKSGSSDNASTNQQSNRQAGVQIQPLSHTMKIWMVKYEELKDFYEKNGHFLIPKKKNKPLHSWVYRQKRENKKWIAGDRSSSREFEERKRLLDSIQFDWRLYEPTLDATMPPTPTSKPTHEPSPTSAANKHATLESNANTSCDRRWMTRFGEVKAYKEKHGHCQIPDTPMCNKVLGKWVNEQRNDYQRWLSKDYSLTVCLFEKRKRLLDNIGFDWNEQDNSTPNATPTSASPSPSPSSPTPAANKHATLESNANTSCDRRWMTRFGEVKAYKEKHGHCQIPDTPMCNKVLGKWVNEQRNDYQRWLSKDYSLTVCLFEKRKRLLDNIGFDWNEQDNSTPDTTPASIPPLTLTNKEHKSVKKSAVRPFKKGRKRNVIKLNSRDLRHRELWRARYEQLKEYRAKTGNCDVPFKYEENKNLAYWVHNQRKSFAKIDWEPNEELKTRKELLEAIEFTWRVR